MPDPLLGVAVLAGAILAGGLWLTFAALLPRKDWTQASHVLIFHGRRTCHAKRPACGACPVARLCPSYGVGETDPVKARTLLAYELAPGAELPDPPPGPLSDDVDRVG